MRVYRNWTGIIELIGSESLSIGTDCLILFESQTKSLLATQFEYKRWLSEEIEQTCDQNYETIYLVHPEKYKVYKERKREAYFSIFSHILRTALNNFSSMVLALNQDDDIPQQVEQLIPVLNKLVSDQLPLRTLKIVTLPESLDNALEIFNRKGIELEEQSTLNDIGFFVHNEFACLVCRSLPKEPVFSACCKGITCRDCFEDQCQLCGNYSEAETDPLFPTLYQDIDIDCMCGETIAFSQRDHHHFQCPLSMFSCSACSRSYSQEEYVRHVIETHPDQLLELHSKLTNATWDSLGFQRVN